ncbi:hypothetical protein FGG08_004517 [Glutinoglossum americanum]|uniref:Uncharacterized protein n=1 Tax=Glutinoglossum americanum TaxID=1670608 RepID=A0A9P8I085_9PEZI|nr:hypothetical protein FGG08_004517 [Glutinoglossum americanum]
MATFPPVLRGGEGGCDVGPDAGVDVVGAVDMPDVGPAGESGMRVLIEFEELDEQQYSSLPQGTILVAAAAVDCQPIYEGRGRGVNMQSRQNLGHSEDLHDLSVQVPRVYRFAPGRYPRQSLFDHEDGPESAASIGSNSAKNANNITSDTSHNQGPTLYGRGALGGSGIFGIDVGGEEGSGPGNAIYTRNLEGDGHVARRIFGNIPLHVGGDGVAKPPYLLERALPAPNSRSLSAPNYLLQRSHSQWVWAAASEQPRAYGPGVARVPSKKAYRGLKAEG